MLSQFVFALEIRIKLTFPLSVYEEISVLSESTLGHLRCSLADVPPQPNSPSEYVL